MLQLSVVNDGMDSIVYVKVWPFLKVSFIVAMFVYLMVLHKEKGNCSLSHSDSLSHIVIPFMMNCWTGFVKYKSKLPLKVLSSSSLPVIETVDVLTVSVTFEEASITI